MTADDRRGAGGYDSEPRRSIFASLWFRVLLVVIVIGVAGVLAVPYVLDLMSPPPPKPVVVGKPAPPALPLPVPAPAPAPAPESAPKPPAPGPSALAPATTAAPATTVEKQSERPKTTQPEKQPARRTAKASAPSAAAGSGAYWVQVGAFKSPEAAKRLAARLREQKYPVAESSTGAGERRTTGKAPSAPPASGSASDKYDVFVVGGSPADITVKLTAKGLSTEAARDGVVVRPSLPLRDAIALSKDLAAEGLKVQVRRSGAPASAAAVPAPAENAGGEVFHRVRVGPYSDRAAATSARKELEEKGYKPFIARR